MVGAPPKYETPEELEKEVEQYLSVTPPQNLTITGLALYLGFESRQSVYDYEEKEQFTYIIKRAKLFIEHAYELKLSGNSPTGAIFVLKNMGWRDKTEVDHSGGIKLSKPSWFDDAMETKTT